MPAAQQRLFKSLPKRLGNGSGSSAVNAADASTPEKFRAINQAQKSPGTVIVYALIRS